MTWILALLACSDPDTAAVDTAEDECPGPTIEEFAPTIAKQYCEWVQACPDPPPIDWTECEDFYTRSWMGFADNYHPCRAQECLDYLGDSLEACQDGEEWGEIEVCGTGYISPAYTVE